MAKKGRKPKYELLLTPENLIRIKGWAMDGLSDEQIAKNMGIAKSTLNDWKTKFPDFSEALKKSKEVADREVENAMHKGAKGYWVEETKKTITEKPDGTQEVKEEVIKKWIPPNPTLSIFWSKNRKPDVWKDKHEVENNIKTGNFKIIIDGEELEDE